jgi:two-component system, NarL family, sensor histidine kinase DevS
VAGSTSGEVLGRRQSERIPDVRARLRLAPQQLGVSDAVAGLIVPLMYRDSELGVLIAFDPRSGPTFGDDDEEALRAFAASAATAVATAQTVAAERLREALAAAEGERRRWARELHDQTLQSLGGLRLLLATARRQADLAGWERVGDQAITEIESEIANLRAIINDLRPQALDELGLTAALHALAEHLRTGGLSIECDLSPAELVLGAELQTTVYRLVQEALTNVVKHARATTARVTVRASPAEITVRVEDDGVGFDTDQPTAGFGMAGMRERVGLARGIVSTDSSYSGTIVLATIPLSSLGIALQAG